MASPDSPDAYADLLSLMASPLPSNASSRLTSPHYVIPAGEVMADRNSPLGTSRRTGSVFKGSWNSSLVAIKVLSSDTPLDTLFERVESWQILKHPHVLEIFGVSSLDADPPFIISQYYPNGDVNEFLAKHPNADRAKIMFECALGMQYLHDRGHVHGSLKPTNILIAENGQARVADYGVVGMKANENSCARYFSPEAWKGIISRPSDVFAFAMSSYEIFMSIPPWGVLSENHIYQVVIREDERPNRLDIEVERKRGLTDNIWGIIAGSWNKEPTLRPTFGQIVELWRNQSEENLLEPMRPCSPSSSVAASSSYRIFSPIDSQSTLTSVQTHRQTTNSDRLLAKFLPGYRNSSAASSVTYNASSGSRIVSPSLNSTSRSWHPDSPSLSNSTIPGVKTLTSPHTSVMMSDVQSIWSNSQPGPPSVTAGKLNAVLLAGALHAELTEGRKQEVIDDYLYKTQILSSHSHKDAHKLVTAGIVPTIVLLLKARAVDAVGLEIVLKTLGILACDAMTANAIYRANTTSALIALLNSADSDTMMVLCAWCINRICRSSEIAGDLVKQGLGAILLRKGLKGSLILSRFSAWCLGILVYTDDLAEILTAHNTATGSVDHLRHVTANENAASEDKSAAIYLVARLARTIPLSKSLAKAGCVPLIIHHLSTSEDPQVLYWSARAVGCLQRPNSSDLAKTLLDAGCANALARLPRVLPSEVVDPLASFAFAIQRLSCAEWGGGTRKALVEAGVVDSLLSALRTSADIPCPQVHIELALATSFLGDVGGASIRKEIVRAGGIDILKQVSSAGKPEVAKICNMAVKSITGNLWTRNAASAKTAMCHDWNGGCPEYQPECPWASTNNQISIGT